MSDNPLNLRKSEEIMLDIMAEHSSEKEWSGPELVNASDGKLDRGTVHIHASSLCDRGLIDFRKEGDEEKVHPSAFPRTFYKVNNKGMKEHNLQKNKKNENNRGAGWMPQPI